MPTHQCYLLFMWARLKSLLRIDTRAFELFSASAKIVWAVGFASLTPFTASSSYGRVDDYFLPMAGVAVLIPFALFHIAAILLDKSGLRRFCIFVGTLRWSWLAFLMYQFPPNYSACMLYSQIAMFGAWSFVAARLRGEVEPKGLASDRRAV